MMYSDTQIARLAKMSERNRFIARRAQLGNNIQETSCPCRKYQVVPLDLKTANSFVEKHHRHNKRMQGHKFSIGLACVDCGVLIGVAICGRPVGRFLDDGYTLEVNRLCLVEGIQNGCSALYAACCSSAKSLGYAKIITYTLMSEQGTSLKASGWKLEAENVGGVAWNSSKSQIREMHHTDLFGEQAKYASELKRRWAKEFPIKPLMLIKV